MKITILEQFNNIFVIKNYENKLRILSEASND